MSIIFGTGASICTAIVVAICNDKHILRVSVQNFTWLGGCADSLRPLVLIRVSRLMRFRDGSDKGTASNF
jgi:hypothetical protein